MSVLITLIIIAILILAHEWGHFLAARKIGIPVHEFSLGFGPKLISTARNGVEYSLRIVPIGGFVRMAGEESEDLNHPDGFMKRTPLEKILVSFAGPFMNFVLAFLIFITAFAVIGIPENTNEPVIGKVISGKPAEMAGLRSGDRIISVNDQPVQSWEEFARFTDENESHPLQISIKRGDEISTLSITPAKIDMNGTIGIGVINSVKYHRFGVIESIGMGLQKTYQMTAELLSYLGHALTGGASMQDVAGPVGITRMVGEFASVGMVFLMIFTAFLSINLGIMNLLPIPALDGSKIVFALVEMVRRKPLEPEKEGFIHMIGFVLLMVLMVVITYHDLVRWFKG